MGYILHPQPHLCLVWYPVGSTQACHSAIPFTHQGARASLPEHSNLSLSGVLHGSLWSTYVPRSPTLLSLDREVAGSRQWEEMTCLYSSENLVSSRLLCSHLNSRGQLPSAMQVSTRRFPSRCTCVRTGSVLKYGGTSSAGKQVQTHWLALAQLRVLVH